MWTAFVTVFLAIWPLLVETESSQLYGYTNGWIPVSSEVVYDQIKHENAHQTPHYVAHKIQLLNTDVNKALPQKTLKIAEKIEPATGETDGRFDDECLTEDSDIGNCNQAKLSNEQVHESKHDYITLIHHHNQNKAEDKTIRRSKKIADTNFKKYAQDLFVPETSSQKSQERTYEVTEDMYELDENKINNEGYKYEPPKKKNQTNGLFEILSKYKITKDDELPNYALSRKHKAHIPSKPITPVIANKQISYSHNNLNHLPVDPLLAVFLSNYGFYLQGMYGVQNRYNNLYGYLASNNIHNNRPFGVYKIYSDTDSSN